MNGSLVPRVWKPAALCCLVNIGLLFVVALAQPRPLRDVNLEANPDARQYLTLGRNFWLHGVYSRKESPPFDPDLMRTPIYPLLAGGLDLVGGPTAVIACNILAHIVTCITLFYLVRNVFGEFAASVAAYLAASDLMLAVNNFQAMSESVFVCLLTCSLALTVPELSLPVGEPANRRRLLLGGLVLGLATLTRPTSLYVPLLLALAIVGRGVFAKRIGAGAMNATLVLAAFAIPVVPWIARNNEVFGVPRLTNVDRNNLVYFVGAGAYELHHGISLDEAQTAIAREYSLPSYSAVQNPWEAPATTPAEMDRELAAATPQVLKKYPKELVLASVIGVAKASISHNVGMLASLVGREWRAPGFGALIRLDRKALGKLFSNGPFLVGALGWQLAHTLAALSLGVVGAVAGLRSSKYRLGTVFLLPILIYFFLTVALFGIEAYWRCRIPVLPLLYVFSSLGMATLWSRPAMQCNGSDREEVFSGRLATEAPNL